MNLVFVIFTVYLIHFSNSQGAPDAFEKTGKYGTIFKKVECINYDNKTGSLIDCYAKSYSRTFNTFNLGYVLNRDLNKPLYVRLVLSFRYGTIYRDVLDTKDLEWCSIMDGASSNQFFMEILKTFDSIGRDKGLFHKCPYKEGTAHFRNITFDENKTRDANILPEGHYIWRFIISKPTNHKIAAFVVYTYTKSPMKNSFGK